MRPQAQHPQATKWIRIWLLLLGLMVYAMILIGGATRLTDSGLSITEWDPIAGAVPPLSDAAWQALFDKYKATAEYRLQNAGMSLAEFKYIFWWEWGHRQMGRLIGLVAVGGLIWFWAKRWLTRRLARRLLILIALGGLQGFVGWWMVASGVGESRRVDVASYRLATHFSLALAIIGLIAWTWMDVGERARVSVAATLKWTAVGLLTAISLQMFAGALVAGLDAGRSYTDWPLMAGELFPWNYIDRDLGLFSFFEGREATQFNHRFLAYAIFAAALSAFAIFRKSILALPLTQLTVLVILQSVWGILTLVSAAPLGLALIHQGLGVLVFLAAVRLVWRAAKD